MVILIETEMAVHKLIFGQPFLFLSDMPQAASAFLFCLSVVLADEYGVLYFNCFAVCQVSADNCNLVSNLETAVGNKVVAVVASCTRAAFEIIKVGKMWVKRKMRKNATITLYFNML